MQNKWIVFWIMVILTALILIGGGTGLQTIPFIGFLGMAFLNLKYKSNLRIAILVLAILMAILNLLPEGGPSWIDAVVWALVVVAWR